MPERVTLVIDLAEPLKECATQSIPQARLQENLGSLFKNDGFSNEPCAKSLCTS